MTVIRCRWKCGDLRGKTWRGRGVMPKGERAENRKEKDEGGDVEDSERELECSGETDRC